MHQSLKCRADVLHHIVTCYPLPWPCSTQVWPTLINITTAAISFPCSLYIDCRQANERTNPLDGVVRQGSSCSNVSFLFRRIIPVDLFYAGGLKPTSRRQNLWPHVASGSIFGRYGNHEMCIHHPRQKGKVFLLSFFGIIDDSKLVCKIWIAGEEGPWATTRWVQLACLFWLYPGYPQSETGPKPELVTSRCSMQEQGVLFTRFCFVTRVSGPDSLILIL